MFSKMISLVISTIMIQTIAGQYLRSGYNPGYGNDIAANLAADNLVYSQAYGPAIAPATELAYESAFSAGRTGLNYGLSLGELGASNGGGLRTQSSSSIPPSGITVESDNMVMEGPLTVSGQLPFLGVVSLEGPLSAAGAGSVAYGSGNGNVGIVSEGVEPPAPAFSNTLTPGYPNAMAPGFPNAMAPSYPNPMAPGYLTGINGIPAFGLGPY